MAQAHFNAIMVPAAANRRFIIAHSSPTFAEYAKPIIKKYGPLGWPVCKKYAPHNPNLKTTIFNNTASREILGIQYRDFPTTMVDMADAMVALGIVKKPKAKAAK